MTATILFHVLLLLALYMIMFVFLANYYATDKNRGQDADDDDDRNDGGGHGGEDNPDLGPIDLPPGVYILPKDAEDPSERTERQPEEVML